jgi:hypothetical protein
VWDALPEDTPGLAELRANPAEAVGIPEWVLNNLVRDHLYISGNDFEGFGDAIYLTRMTATGSLVGRFARLVPGITRDRAGGLNLCEVDGSDVWFAVRGRTLIVSRDRSQLIRALTLRPKDRIPRDELASLVQTGGEDVRGLLVMDETGPGGGAVRHVGFAMIFDENGASAKCRAVLNDEWQTKLAPIVSGVSPRTLTAPPPGLIELSLDVDKPFETVWTALGDAFDLSFMSSEQWTAWAQGETGVAKAITGLAGPQGPGIRMSLHGIDVNEIFPMPEVVALLDADTEKVGTAFALTPAPPEDAMPWDSYARYSEETGLLTVPMIGGPSLEPTAAVENNQLLISSSRTVAESLLEAGLPHEGLPRQGNLYVNLQPEACVDAWADAGAVIAEYGLLRDHTPATFEASLAEWRRVAEQFQSITAFVAVNDGALTAELLLSSKVNGGS